MALPPIDDESFGMRLRRLREAAALTQEELAARAGLTSNAIGALERGERRRPYPHTVRALADVLGLDEQQLASLAASARAQRAVPTPPIEEPPVPVPRAVPVPPSTLLGRDREMGEALALLRSGETRLLTLTGPGGVGKTRLAMEVVAALAAEFPDGAVVVELAPVGEVQLVMTTVARAIGLRETGGRDVAAALVDFLRDRRPLLLLDNLEHLLAAAPDLADLVARCPDLVVLVTSRAPLRVRAEREYPVAPLAVPDPRRTPDAATVGAAPAARMFLDRARSAAASFTLTDENAAAVAAICWRLDGLPLALELAAARARFLGPTALLARLDEAVGAPGARDLPERQQTMRATLDWSHALLAADEQSTFRGLAVFTGGFSLGAVEAVVGDIGGGGDVLGSLGGLVEQSLVVLEGSGDEPRYRMLEPVRQYAEGLLAAAGETGLLRTRHAAYYCALGRDARPALRASGQAVWLDLLQREHGNLRSALSWLIGSGAAADAAALGWDTWLFWALRGHAGEGSRWMERAAAADGLAPRDRAKALVARAGLLYATGEVPRMLASARVAVELSRDSGDPALTAEAMVLCGSAEAFSGDFASGRAVLAEALIHCRAASDEWALAHAVTAQGQCALLAGDLASAAVLLDEAEAIARAVGSPFTLATILNIRATVTQLTGDDDATLALLGEAVAQSVAVGATWTLIYSLPGLAGVAARRGDPERAARLFGAAAAQAEANSLVLAFPATRDLYDRNLPLVRDQLGDDAFRLAWSAGQALSLDETAVLASGISRSSAPQ